jgi:hypothetical protein
MIVLDDQARQASKDSLKLRSMVLEKVVTGIDECPPDGGKLLKRSWVWRIPIEDFETDVQR